MTRTILSSLEDTIAKLHGQLGVSWPNPWWPTGNSADNDCAAFQSWGLWGLNGNQPFETVVSGVIEHSGLEFHAGNQGIQRGDLLGLRWSAQVNYNHIGMALGAPDSAGRVQTIDANGGSNKVAISVRNIRNVHNFARPHYPSASTASNGSTPLNERHRTMFSLIPLGAAEGIDVVSLITGIRAHVDSTYHVGLLTRVRDNDGTDTMLPAEVDIVRGYLSKINPPSAGGAAPAIDYAALAKAVNDDAAKRLAS